MTMLLVAVQCVMMSASVWVWNHLGFGRLALMKPCVRTAYMQCTSLSAWQHLLIPTHRQADKQFTQSVQTRGVVVRERGGTPFRQITSYSLGWPSISLFSGPNCPQMRDLASKISKKFLGVTPRTPSVGGGNPSRTYPQHGYTPCMGALAPPLLGPRSRKPFLQIKIYHYTPGKDTNCFSDFTDAQNWATNKLSKCRQWAAAMDINYY